MRVLLVSAPYPLEEFPLPSLALSYLAGVLQAEGVEVQILDLLVAEHSAAKIEERLAQYRPQLVGTSCVTMTYPTASEILKVCKGFDPGIVTVIGGPHVSFAATETLSRAPWIDIVVRGEGEGALMGIVRALQTGAHLGQVSGIAFREDKAVVMTEPHRPVENLDALPLPARHLLPLSRYRGLRAACTVITSRGCPFNCIFCCAPKMFGRRVRFRSPELVVDEIEMIHKELGFQRINIVDDTLTVNHKHVHRVCHEIKRRNLDIEWSAYSRVDTVSERLLHSMKEAGCQWLCFGIESGSQEILDRIGKGITVEKARRGVELTTRMGIKALASFILGLPGETPQSAQSTYDLALELNSEYGAAYGFHLLAPLPGTEVFEQADKYGIRILTTDWANYDANQPVAESVALSAEGVREIKARYDGAVSYAWEEIKLKALAGDCHCQQEVRERSSQEFVWRLLKEDAIEKLGRLGAVDTPDAEAGLARRVAQGMAVPLEFAQQEVGRLIEQGLLRLERGREGSTWRWS